MLKGMHYTRVTQFRDTVFLAGWMVSDVTIRQLGRHRISPCIVASKSSKSREIEIRSILLAKWVGREFVENFGSSVFSKNRREYSFRWSDVTSFDYSRIHLYNCSSLGQNNSILEFIFSLFSSTMFKLGKKHGQWKKKTYCFSITLTRAFFQNYQEGQKGGRGFDPCALAPFTRSAVTFQSGKDAL